MSTSEDGWRMRVRGVRGATVVAEDTREEIHAAIRELITAILEANDIDIDDLASAFFTTTPDLHSAFPAEGARHMGWEYVPLLGSVEMDKTGGPGRCIRALPRRNPPTERREKRHVL